MLRDRLLASLALVALACRETTPDAIDPPDPVCVDVPLSATESRCGASASSDRTTFTCGDTTLSIASLGDGVIRLREGRVTSLAPRPWAIERAPDESRLTLGRSCDGLVRACDGHWALELDPATCRVVRMIDVSGAMVMEDARSTVSNDALTWQRTLAPEEHLAGLGEHTGAVELRGRTRTLWNTDAYDAAFGGFRPDADPLYLNVPLLLSARAGRWSGHFINDTHRLRYDLGATDARTLRVTAATDAIEHHLVAGPAPADVLRRYTALTGRPPLPPRWALGYHQSRWGYRDADRVLEIARELRRREIPADALWLDIQHMRGFRSFTFDPVTFADPTGLTRELAALGFHTVAIVDPGLKVDAAWDVYAQGLADRHFLRRANGDTYEGNVWPGRAVFPDFSAPSTRDWWSGLVRRLTDVGVDGIWIDMNEPATFDAGTANTVPDELPIHGDGAPATMATLHNAYALLEAKATYTGLASAHPDRRPFVLTRAGCAGTQRYGAVWTGDAPSSWATLRQTPSMIMTLGLSGIGFAGSDVGGYSGGASPELFARWMQVGSISPFFRGHVTENVSGQEPWAFGTEVEIISREAIRERYRRMPYLYDLFSQAHETGAPVLRPVAWDRPEIDLDDDRVMLGPWLLVAPVIEPGASVRRVSLPAGRWLDERSNRLFTGPATFDLDVSLAALPTFVREGAILPLAPGDGTLELDLFPVETRSEWTHHEDAGDGYGPSSRVTYETQRDASGAFLRASARSGDYRAAARRVVVRMRRVDAAPTSVTLDGISLAPLDSEAAVRSGSGWFYDVNDRSLFAAFDDRDVFDLRATFDPTIRDAPTVRRRFRVKVPADTATDEVIHVALSTNGWTHVPLSAPQDGVAEAEVEIPRGVWFEYKYTRGGWDTVEKWPGCVEAKNRYTFSSARFGHADDVAAWADGCR